MACIYKIENKQNGKVYIGQTKRTLDWRLNNNWCGHFVRAFTNMCNSRFYNALRKYGKAGFTYEVIDEKFDFKTKEDLEQWLNDKEKFYIEKYSSNNKLYGYNMTSGGDRQFKLSKEQRQKISEATKLAMSTMNTKELCNPKRGRTKEDIDLWKKRNSIANSIKVKQQWADPIKRQNILKTRQNRCWVHKEDERHFIKKEDLQLYLDMGFSKGSGYNCNKTKGKICINNGIKSCFIDSKDIQLYMDNGYKKGRLK